jgi:transcription-repair coupling factor (superfamily II helicase)
MARDEAAKRDVHAALGPTVKRLCEAVESGDVIAVASSEMRGAAIARAASAMTSALVLWFPPPDTLPGEIASPSAAISGQRVATLAALQRRNARRILLVTEATAATQKVAPPEAFATPTLTIVPAENLIGEEFAEALEAIGYFRDERVDEPGEFAVRAGAIDLFPADLERPIRIHLDEGKIDRIDSYDPVTQLGSGEALDRLAIGPAAEPQPGADAGSLFEHLPGAAVALDPEAVDRRDRFAELAAEAAGANGTGALAADWDRLLDGRRKIDVASGGETEGIRFVEARSPEPAFRQAFDAARETGSRILIAGSARDVRFLSRRIEKRVGEAPQPVADWMEVEQAAPRSVLATTAELGRGWSEPGLLVVTAADILGERAIDTRRVGAIDPLSGEVTDFHLGDAVIHETHGLGILQGIDRIAAGEGEHDAIRIGFAGETSTARPRRRG